MYHIMLQNEEKLVVRSYELAFAGAHRATSGYAWVQVYSGTGTEIDPIVAIAVDLSENGSNGVPVRPFSNFVGRAIRFLEGINEAYKFVFIVHEPQSLDRTQFTRIRLSANPQEPAGREEGLTEQEVESLIRQPFTVLRDNISIAK